MPIPSVIGIYLACLVTCACTVTKTAERTTSDNIASSKAKISTRASPGSACGEIYKSSDASPPLHQTERHGLGLRVAEDVCRDAASLCCAQMQATENSRFGDATWYDLVGQETASGEILDTVTATAANLSLPLGSFARVTDLDNGRSVIVKINDRGPYTRGRIIDLSPRAAEVLHMKTAGVAAVLIEPMENRVDPVVDAFDTADLEVAQ